jgi:hypothetical protein
MNLCKIEHPYPHHERDGGDKFPQTNNFPQNNNFPLTNFPLTNNLLTNNLLTNKLLTNKLLTNKLLTNQFHLQILLLQTHDFNLESSTLLHLLLPQIQNKIPKTKMNAIPKTKTGGM